MASTLIALLLLAIFSCISAQDIACPPGSFLQTDVTTFTVPSSPKSLESTLGDFYSNS
ncbi:uncharacterized protein H6S33_002798, partial [Morchella sextelata]|uniref:uncharacterized protein n=1 Tax=Morchella sextelata TaxID=1174677 RepID=UPI001D03BCDB